MIIVRTKKIVLDVRDTNVENVASICSPGEDSWKRSGLVLLDLGPEIGELSFTLNLHVLRSGLGSRQP